MGFRTCAILILAAYGTAMAGVPLRVERFSTSEGLSQNSVSCVLQDRLGFLWVGGENGLNRYDGYGFQTFNHDPDNPDSLPSNQVYTLLEDRSGAIWIGTVDAGLARYDYHTNAFTTFRHCPDDPTSLAHNDVRTLAMTSDGTVWAGTEAGVALLRPGGTSFQRHLLAPDTEGDDPRNSVIVLAVSPEDTVWAGTEGGLFRYEGCSDRFNPHVDPGGPMDSPVWALAFENPDILWVGTFGHGAARLDLRSGERRWWRHDPADPSGLSGAHVTAIIIDYAGRIWIGTSDRGLDLIEPDSAAVTRIPLTRDIRRATAGGVGIRALYEDRSQILWIGTNFEGLLKTDLKTSGFLPLVPREVDGREFGDHVVFAIAEDRKQRFWIGGSAGLYQMDPLTGVIRSFPLDPARHDRPVYAILPQTDDTLWVGTWAGGLVHMDPESGQRRIYRHDPDDPDSLAHDRPLTLLEDSRGRLWVGTWGGGLDLFDRDSGTFLHHRVSDGTGLASDRIRALCEGDDGTLWVGTTGGGLSRFDPTMGRFITYRTEPGNPGSLSHNDIAFIFSSSRGMLWLATGGGLNKFDPATGRFKSYRVADGLSNDAVTAVLEDIDGMIWFAHFAGISRIDPATDSVVNFDASDGLAGTEFNAGAACATRSGTLLFGGVGGVTAVRPDKVSHNPYPPRTVLTSFTVYGRELELSTSVTVADEIRLSHKQDFLGFEFTGLEFTAPQRNTYAHRLAGYHQDWVSCGTRRFATYTNLPPGFYTFEVRAANNHGVWSVPARLRIVIDPPFWQTWWFRGAAFVFAALALVAVTGWRTRTLRLRLAEQERLVSERTAQLAAANTELQAMARRDELTGAANRRLFNEFLDAEWRRSARFSRPLSLAIIDIDDFKIFNDTFGHPAGDMCLRRVAEALRGLANRPGDLFARYGGEEFVVVLSETGPGEAVVLAERMREAVVALNFVHAPGLARSVVTVSIGIATLTPAIGGDPFAILAAADAALYSAKVSGKNRVAVAGADPSRNTD